MTPKQLKTAMMLHLYGASARKIAEVLNEQIEEPYEYRRNGLLSQRICDQKEDALRATVSYTRAGGRLLDFKALRILTHGLNDPFKARANRPTNWIPCTEKFRSSGDFSNVPAVGFL